MYILQCNNGSYYVGITNDLERRLYEHINGINDKAFTFDKRPLKLVFHYRFDNVNDAINFEKQIKGWRKEKKEALVNGDWHMLPDLSRTSKNKITNTKKL
ncbi:GIY-YIG nuclease family protein [Mucilaginibacter ginkgonis]|uniref:GIY-YIG nuclease family protein n=1 Tax=Mucilaginibacter ginkgonis TaxID=2682091 RepID=A0A6I4I0H5_9SPHI|nr:GIY-YIG nuclease family protein [Mucilaginibacter ginkgonis]QQL49020.1 GIY-YIG nuclease family protein [Mucilaginibacter ginkgonis]